MLYGKHASIYKDETSFLLLQRYMPSLRDDTVGPRPRLMRLRLERGEYESKERRGRLVCLPASIARSAKSAQRG